MREGALHVREPPPRRQSAGPTHSSTPPPAPRPGPQQRRPDLCEKVSKGVEGVEGRVGWWRWRLMKKEAELLGGGDDGRPRIGGGGSEG